MFVAKILSSSISVNCCSSSNISSRLRRSMNFVRGTVPVHQSLLHDAILSKDEEICLSIIDCMSSEFVPNARKHLMGKCILDATVRLGNH